MKTSSLWGYVYLALAASIWGGMYVVSKYVLRYIPPLSLVWIRYLVAIIVLFGLLAILRVKRGKKLTLKRRDWLLVIAIGFVGYFISIICQFVGTSLADAHTGSLITSATPAFVAIFAKCILKEKMTGKKILSLVVATVGVLITIGIPSGHGSYFWGDLFLVLAALTWALLTVFVKLSADRNMDTLIVTAYAMLIAWVLTTPFMSADLYAGAIHWQGGLVIWGILYLGIVSTAGAFFLWNKGFEMVDASVGSLFLFFQPVFGSLFGWILLGEQVTLRFFLGSLFIMAGIFIAASKDSWFMKKTSNRSEAHL